MGRAKIKVIATRIPEPPLTYTRPLAGLTVKAALEFLDKGEGPFLWEPFYVNGEEVSEDSELVLKKGNTLRGFLDPIRIGEGEKGGADAKLGQSPWMFVL